MEAFTAGAERGAHISYHERLSDLFGNFRLDAEAYTPEVIQVYEHLSALETASLGDHTFITDGQHGYHIVDPNSPVRHLTAKCIQNWFVDDSGADRLALETHEKNLRSSCEADDVLLSTAGTLGKAAIVTPDNLPANMDQDIARIHLETEAIDPWYLVAFLNSAVGRLQSERVSTGQVQRHIALGKIREFEIPVNVDQESIAKLVKEAFELQTRSESLYAEAEALLLAELGLGEWAQQQRQTSEVSETSEVLASQAEVLASQAWAAGRLDAEYFQPKYARALAIMGQSGKTIGDVARLAKRRFEPRPGKPFQYIEIADVRQAGHAESKPIPGEEAPSRAQWIVKADDVITSTVRPIRRLSALIESHQDGYVCTSGFAILKPSDIEPEVLLVYLRLPIVCEILDLYTSASMYPAISTTDLLNVPISLPSEQARAELVRLIQRSRDSRLEAQRLLEEAKRRVEEMVLGSTAQTSEVSKTSEV